jgi:hypothetical protein
VAPPPPPMKPFEGSGQALGAATTSTSTRDIDAAIVANHTQGSDFDASLPSTSLQIRLTDGKTNHLLVFWRNFYILLFHTRLFLVE